MLTLKQVAHEKLEMRPGLCLQSCKVHHHQGASGFGMPWWEALLGHSPLISKLIQNAQLYGACLETKRALGRVGQSLYHQLKECLRYSFLCCHLIVAKVKTVEEVGKLLNGNYLLSLALKLDSLYPLAPNRRGYNKKGLAFLLKRHNLGRLLVAREVSIQ